MKITKQILLMLVTIIILQITIKADKKTDTKSDEFKITLTDDEIEKEESRNILHCLDLPDDDLNYSVSKILEKECKFHDYPVEADVEINYDKDKKLYIFDVYISVKKRVYDNSRYGFSDYR